LKTHQTFTKELKIRVNEVNNELTTFWKKQRNLQILLTRDNVIILNTRNEMKWNETKAAAAVKQHQTEFLNNNSSELKKQKKFIEKSKRLNQMPLEKLRNLELVKFTRDSQSSILSE
jgi:hypothetical protein